jgi:AcrR family transcriptional regulator
MKKNYHHGELKGALIDAALEILQVRGIESLTIRAAAQKTAVSHTAPYRHFKNKDELMVALALRGLAILAETVDSAMYQCRKDQSRAVRHVGLAYLTFACEHSELYRLIFGRDIRNKRENGDFFTAYDGLFQKLRSMIEVRIGQGDDSALVALAVWSAIHGYASFLIDNSEYSAALMKKQAGPLLDIISRMVVRP